MTEVTIENNGFVLDKYNIIRWELFLNISTLEKPYHYYIELQTKNDVIMIVRMIEYGF